MLYSKLSRASSVRPQQPLFRPRFTSQSFNRSVRSPRYRAKDTNLRKTPEKDGKTPFDVPAFLGGLIVGLFIGTLVQVLPSKEPELDHNLVTPPQHVVFLRP
jgi:hypothetical protein